MSSVGLVALMVVVAIALSHWFKSCCTAKS
jgi:hypothetical protein